MYLALVDYFVLILVVIIFGNLLSFFGINPAWIVIPIIVLTLPTVYTTFSGSPFLPTDKSTLKRMIKLADILPGDLVYDLGCGDGRIMREAAKRGAKTIGYEISIYLYLAAKWFGSGDVRLQNFWNADLSDADVIFCFIGPRAMARFELEKWHTLKPGCRVIVHAFAFPNLEPTATDLHVYRYDKE